MDTYTIKGPLYLNWSDSSDVSVKTKQMRSFINEINKMLYELFAIPGRQYIWIECEWNGLISISGKYAFKRGDLHKMNRILVGIVNNAANEAGVTISGDISFCKDSKPWPVRE